MIFLDSEHEYGDSDVECYQSNTCKLVFHERMILTAFFFANLDEDSVENKISYKAHIRLKVLPVWELAMHNKLLDPSFFEAIFSGVFI
jgi:hypothetical protein